MQIVRFRAGSVARYGVLDGATVVEYSGVPWSAFRRGRRRHALRQVVLLAPVLPSKIVAIELNFRERAAELGAPLPDDPLITFKPPSAVVGPGDPIVLPPQSELVEHEAELAIVIKRRCRNVAPGRARDYVLGYTAINDVTARDLRVRDGRPERAKGFDTFCPLGPCIASDIDPSSLTVEALVNGVVRQTASTKDLIFPVEDLVARVSQTMTLFPGDVIAAGTPGGASALAPGDHVEVRVEGVGSLRNPVVKL
ncbi:MAG TPA: fumarylacetoacetate hydrolase family protein [Methylomirabilota bacterium]|jgi:2-keto-4-pentenoate hydratase/2-oxohepta-3-ene-1,7-dioic acid hydratase in catechol pathway|nr:fumarylacetoacetate hydrolase family protein [Methylomirabilota bacterium]